MSSASCSKVSFSRTTQRCQNHRGIVYKGQYTLYQHAIQLLILIWSGFINVRAGSCCRYLIALRPVSPQTEPEQLWSPEENNSKIKLLLCIAVHSWKRRGIPLPKHTLWDLPAVSSFSFHVLNIKPRRCTQTPVLCAICVAYLIYVRVVHSEG